MGAAGSTKDGGKPSDVQAASNGQALSDIPALKPYWGKPAVRNFREGHGNVGIIRSPLRAIALPDPYRIPGAVDYSTWPILQILHVRKQGLQFHEMCINVWGHRGFPEAVSVSRNDRRLFQYRFQQGLAHVEVPKVVGERIAPLIQSLKTVKSNREPIKPLRGWNDEGWYVAGEEVELEVYTKENQVRPPQEVVELFHDLENLPRSQQTSEGRKDVCLGFCYDPLSGLGALFANHRCRWEETRVVCR